MQVVINGQSFQAVLADNESVDAFKQLLADGPITLDMQDFGNMELNADLGTSLPQSNVVMNTVAGDIILYQGNILAIYYAPNSYSLTPIAKIDADDAAQIKDLAAGGSASVTLSLEQ